MEYKYSDILQKFFPFWEHLTDIERHMLCDSTTVVTYQKGETIHKAEENCKGVFLVQSGHLRTYMLSEEGREITLFRLFAGDTCILSASCVLSTITFDVFVDAEADSKLYVVSSPVFRQLTEQNIYVEAYAYKLATQRFSDVMWAMQQILFMSMDKRLAIFLWDELAKTDGDVVHLTHEQIARYMGSAREVVTRMLRYFADAGIVSLSRGGIRILDKKRLREMT